MNRKVEITVGLFMVMVICAVLFLCFKVTDATTFTSNSSYRVYAVFDNVGGLKARSPVKIGGVVIGRINNITLDNYKPYVSIDINSQYNEIPSSSALSIKTSGLLGEQFIDVAMGIDNDAINELDELDAQESGAITKSSDVIQEPKYFEQGFVIHNTKPAMVIEDLIGQFLYSSGASDKKDSTEKTTD